MKKRFLSLLLALMMTLSLASCAQQTPSQPETGSDISAELSAQTEGQKFLCVYSNLSSPASCELAEEILTAAEVSDQRRAVFFDHVQQFNEAVDGSLLAEALEERDILHPAYDPYDYQDQWMEKHPDFGGYNCRITAFGLAGDLISVDETAEIRDNDLFMDVESLEADPSALLDGALDTFRRFYSTVPTENTTDITAHAEAIRQDWQERGVSIREDEHLSLVTVWFHNQWSEEENELFIGHVGVLADTEKGLYFFEKVAFQEPYQMIQLSDRQELSDYLLAKYDNQWGQDTARPFLMENDHLMME